MAPKTTRNYTYVEIIREMRREASLAAMQVLDKAEKLGVPREKAEELADKILLYELTPEEAEAKLKELAARASGSSVRAK